MKLRKSLYVHIIISFGIILLFLFLVANMYFGHAREYIIRTLANQNLIGSDIQSRRELIGKAFSGLNETLAISVIFGLIIILVVVEYIIKPIRQITNATKQVAKGNFNVKLELKRNDEIGELAENFNKMVKELNNNEYLSKEFISNVSHEFKTPIASIQGFAKLLKDDKTTEEEKSEYLDIIIEETERLANLSNNIQKLSRLENKDIVKLEDEIAIDEQIRKCIVMFTQKFDEKNINISMNEKNLKIKGNEELLQQVWINLINNAIKYTPKDGEIEINLEENEKKVIVEVKDNGIGIDKEKQKRIFEKFYQVDSSHSAEGNGLGLAIVKKIIEIHEGKILVESEVGEGTTFRIELPKIGKNE